MNTNKMQSFAAEARTSLMKAVRARIDLHRKYNFINYLPAYINIKHPGGGFDLTGKIKATNFVQKKNEEHAKPDLVAKPVVKLAQAETFELTEAKEERFRRSSPR